MVASQASICNFTYFLFSQASCKFIGGELTTLVEYDTSVSELRPPSVSVCPVEGKVVSNAKVGTELDLLKDLAAVTYNTNLIDKQHIG